MEIKQENSVLRRRKKIPQRRNTSERCVWTECDSTREAKEQKKTNQNAFNKKQTDEIEN